MPATSVGCARARAGSSAARAGIARGRAPTGFGAVASTPATKARRTLALQAKGPYISASGDASNTYNDFALEDRPRRARHRPRSISEGPTQRLAPAHVPRAWRRTAPWRQQLGLALAAVLHGDAEAEAGILGERDHRQQALDARPARLRRPECGSRTAFLAAVAGERVGGAQLRGATRRRRGLRAARRRPGGRAGRCRRLKRCEVDHRQARRHRRGGGPARDSRATSSSHTRQFGGPSEIGPRRRLQAGQQVRCGGW